MPQVICQTNWAHSSQKRSMALYHSENLIWSTVSRPILMMGGVHGDEPEGLALAEGLLQWLLSSEGQTQTPWILIPCLNPDGVQAHTRVNGSGVDLNRNYPARSWSAHFTNPRYYPGPHPASEPEIQAIVRLIYELHPRLILHFHSWNPCIVLTGPPALHDAHQLAQVSGYPLQESIGYETPGSLSQFGWWDQQIPVICIEEKEQTPAAEVWPRFQPAFVSILNDMSSRKASP